MSFSLDDVAEEESFRPRAHSVERISRAKIKSVKQVLLSKIAKIKYVKQVRKLL